MMPSAWGYAMYVTDIEHSEDGERRHKLAYVASWSHVGSAIELTIQSITILTSVPGRQFSAMPIE